VHLYSKKQQIKKSYLDTDLRVQINIKGMTEEQQSGDTNAMLIFTLLRSFTRLENRRPIQWRCIMNTTVPSRRRRSLGYVPLMTETN
jgi:hypothetical protein